MKPFSASGHRKSFNDLSKRQQRRVIKKAINRVVTYTKKKTILKNLKININEPQNNVPNENNENHSDANNVNITENFILPDKKKISVSVGSNGSNSDDESYEPGDLSENELDLAAKDDIDALNRKEDFRNWYSQWVVTEKIKHSASDKLLKKLKNDNHFPNLPKDTRTLLQTPQNIEVRKVGRGEYTHIGLENCLNALLDTHASLRNSGRIDLYLNFDGIPLAKNQTQLWPILASVAERPDIEPFAIGIYKGTEKPCCVHLFLKDLLSDAKKIEKNHGHYYNNKLIQINFKACICDGPARALIQAIAGHNAFHGCNKCKKIGKRKFNRTVFSSKPGEPRTDLDFLNKVQHKHHLPGTDSPLIDLVSFKFAMVSKFPYEYMHLLVLGAMRKMLTYFRIKGRKSYLKPDSYQKISEKLIYIKKYIPLEFARKPRSLDELKHFKATELRQILFHTGPFIFKDCVNPETYYHYLTLHYAVRILSCKKLIAKYIDYAEVLLKNFVKNFSKIYGPESISYNIHGILHVVEDVKKFGPLDEYSAFKFENYLQKLIHLLQTKTFPLQQLAKRLHENMYIKKFKCPPPLHNDNNTLYSTNGTIKCDSIANNCVVLNDGKIVEVKQLTIRDNAQGSLIGSSFQNVEPFYVIPDTSVDVGIYKASSLETNVKSWPVTAIKCKAIKIPYKDDPTTFYISELLHEN